MLKNETLEDLKKTFTPENVGNELNEFIPDITSGVEIVNLDLVRVHINARGSDVYINKIIEILQANNEPGPLTLHEEAASSCNLLWYIDIING